jgi:Group 4 capsule polysaccharide lipoprotein gfcB, YjbF
MRSRRPDPTLLGAVAALTLALSLAGCSSEGGGDWFEMYQVARNAWENRDAPATLKDAEAIPYATLGVRLGGGREQILILATESHGERLWTSGTTVAILTRNGRVVRTAGFGTDLSGFNMTAEHPPDATQATSYTWTADFADLALYSVPIVCHSAPAGPDPIEILGKQFETVRVDETCSSDSLNWTYTNSYWVSTKSGRVWRMRVQPHPKGPEFELELLRPPATPG